MHACDRLHTTTTCCIGHCACLPLLNNTARGASPAVPYMVRTPDALLHAGHSGGCRRAPVPCWAPGWRPQYSRQHPQCRSRAARSPGQRLAAGSGRLQRLEKTQSPLAKVGHPGAHGTSRLASRSTTALGCAAGQNLWCLCSILLWPIRFPSRAGWLLMGAAIALCVQERGHARRPKRRLPSAWRMSAGPPAAPTRLHPAMGAPGTPMG